MLCNETLIYDHSRINQIFKCPALVTFWKTRVVSTDTDTDARLVPVFVLPQACWDWRNWFAAFSSPGRPCQSGCWMTTWTLRRCWRRSVTTKWPRSSLTPTLPSPISSSRRWVLKRQYVPQSHLHIFRSRSYSCIQCKQYVSRGFAYISLLCTHMKGMRSSPSVK